jgi:hypothetical protein
MRTSSPYLNMKITAITENELVTLTAKTCPLIMDHKRSLPISQKAHSPRL